MKRRRFCPQRQAVDLFDSLESFLAVAINGSGFPGWTKKSEMAAMLVAEDFRPDRLIAEDCGIGLTTLERWKLNPEFRSRVTELQGAIRTEIRARGIAIIENRIRSQHERWVKMQDVITARSEDESLSDVPGGATGLLVHNVKGVGRGEDFQLIDLYEVDTGLLREMRELEKHTATELGQWTERTSADVVERIVINSIEVVEPESVSS